MKITNVDSLSQAEILIELASFFCADEARIVNGRLELRGWDHPADEYVEGWKDSDHTYAAAVQILKEYLAP